MSTEQPMIPQLAPKVHAVSFSAEVNANTCEALLALMANLVNQQVTDVHLLLSTPGGSVMHGMTIYNVLRGLPVKLTTHNVGNVDSIGNVIFLAGAHRRACPHSTFMFHGVGINVEKLRLEGKHLREYLANISADNTRIGRIIAQHTSLTEDQITGLFGEAQTKDADFAVGCGIVHEVTEVELPAGVPVHALVFKR